MYNMNSKTRLITLGLVLALGAGQEAWATQQKEEDSVYQWGRWSVLSPAAGGEAYKAALAPDAANNARPGDADEFQPVVASVGTPPVEPPPVEPPPVEPPPVDVVDSCVAGAACGFATYSRQEGDGPRSGPVLASFELSETPMDAPDKFTNFAVTDSGDESFPDVNSDTAGHFSDGADVTGTKGVPIRDRDLGTLTSDSETATLSHSNQDTGQVYDLDGVDAGYWRQLAQQRVSYFLGDRAGTSEINTISDSDGYFVHGLVATVEQMEAFAAGRVSATYNGFVLDYASPVRLNFNFDNNTFNGNFDTANGFSGFEIDGAVNGVNFSATDAGKEVAGSFFNGGFNASGAVNNGTQTGVFSTDLAGTN